MAVLVNEGQEDAHIVLLTIGIEANWSWIEAKPASAIIIVIDSDNIKAKRKTLITGLYS